MFKLSIPNEEYQSWKDNNKDGYEAFTFKCAEKWAELMELEMVSGVLTKEIIKNTKHNPITDQSSGAQMGMALSILKKCWKYGNMLPDSLYDI